MRTTFPTVAEATCVTYPAGSVQDAARIVGLLPDNRPGGAGRLLVITDITPFHPLDPLWPDQPADHGMLSAGASIVAVRDTVTIARRGEGPVMVGEAVDARRDEPGVLFLVGHVVDAEAAALLAVGMTVTLVVEAGRRRRLSAAHTACHLLAYALNEVTHHLWRKPAHTDSRGHHDLDHATCVSTRHDEAGSIDRYRFGKSLRRRGFDAERLIEDLSSFIDQVNGRLAEWIEADACVRIETTGPTLVDRRQWVCEIPGGTAQMPCGGTHVRRLGEIASMTAVASYDETGLLQIINKVRVRT